MMPIALENGIKIKEYEELSFYEVSLTIEAKQKVKEEDFKANILLDYQMVDLMLLSLGRLFDNKVEFPAIEDIYPELFAEDARLKAAREEQARLKEEMEAKALAAQWQALVMANNQKIKRKKDKETEVKK